MNGLPASSFITCAVLDQISLSFYTDARQISVVERLEAYRLTDQLLYSDSVSICAPEV